MDPCAEVISFAFQFSQVGTLIRSFHSLVQPQFNKILSFCEELTGISQEMVEIAGNDLGLTLERFDTWVSQLKMRYHVGPDQSYFSSFGNWDLTKAIPRNCMFREIDLPPCLRLMEGKFVNIRTKWAEINNSPLPDSISHMLGQVGLVFVGREHNAMCDVDNITRMLRYLESKQIDIKAEIAQTIE